MAACNWCGTPHDRLLACSRCRSVAYCDQACQAADWAWSGGHSSVCSPRVMRIAGRNKRNENDSDSDSDPDYGEEEEEVEDETDRLAREKLERRYALDAARMEEANRELQREKEEAAASAAANASASRKNVGFVNPYYAFDATPYQTVDPAWRIWLVGVTKWVVNAEAGRPYILQVEDAAATATSRKYLVVSTRFGVPSAAVKSVIAVPQSESETMLENRGILKDVLEAMIADRRLLPGVVLIQTPKRERRAAAAAAFVSYHGLEDAEVHADPDVGWKLVATPVGHAARQALTLHVNNGGGIVVNFDSPTHTATLSPETTLNLERLVRIGFQKQMAYAYLRAAANAVQRRIAEKNIHEFTFDQFEPHEDENEYAQPQRHGNKRGTAAASKRRTKASRTGQMALGDPLDAPTGDSVIFSDVQLRECLQALALIVPGVVVVDREDGDKRYYRALHNRRVQRSGTKVYHLEADLVGWPLRTSVEFYIDNSGEIKVAATPTSSEFDVELSIETQVNVGRLLGACMKKQMARTYGGAYVDVSNFERMPDLAQYE